MSRNVDYLLLSEFDILLGSQLTHQYPGPPGCKPSMLAELMLPEGAHARDSDWTTFLIDASMVSDWTVECREKEEKEKEKAARREARERANQLASQGTSQSTNQSTNPTNDQIANSDSVSQSKSSSSVDPSVEPAPESTNQSILQSSNPSSSSSPDPETNQSTESTTRSQDQSANQSTNESNNPTILQSADTPMNHSASPSDQSVNDSATQSLSSVGPLKDLPAGEQLVVLNLCRTKLDPTVKRGAIVKSLAIVTKLRFYSVLKPLVMLALDQIFSVAGVPINSATSESQAVDQTVARESIQGILSELFDSINAIEFPTSLNNPLSVQSRLYSASRMRLAAGGSDAETENVTCLARYNNMNFTLKLPAFMSVDETLDASLTKLLAILGDRERVMALYTAVIAEKRVLFLGYGRPANDLCHLVLSTCLLVSPPVYGTLKRAYPYASLTNTNFLQVPGYIAGVTNPIFDKTEWYDLCINITENTMTFSPAYLDHIHQNQSSAQAAAQQSLDSAFYTELHHGQVQKYGEEWTRCMFRDLTNHILSMAQGKAVFADRVTERAQLDAQHYRIEQLKASDAFIHLQVMKQQQRNADEQACQQTSDEQDSMPWHHIEDLVIHHVRTLQSKPTSIVETDDIVTELNRLIDSEGHINQLLCLMPETQGALMPIGMLLFNANEHVRQQAFALLYRIDQTVEGRKWISALSYFVLLNYYPMAKKLQKLSGINE